MNKNVVGIVCGYSLELPAMRNRLIPLVKNLIIKNYRLKIYCPGNHTLDLNDENIEFFFIDKSNNKINNNYLRGFSELLISRNLMKNAYKNNHDILYIGIPSIFNLLFVKQIKGKQFLDIRDLSWEYLRKSNFLNLLIINFFKYISNIKFRYFDLITCTNSSEIKYIKKYKNFKKELYILPNGISSGFFDNLQNRIDNSFNNQIPISVSYIGNVSNAQNLTTLVRAAHLCPNINFNIIGTGRDIERVENLSMQLGLKNLKFHGRVNQNDVLKFYKRSNILYAQLSENFSYALPSKLYEYLSTGKRIIYGGIGEARKFLEEFENITLIDPDDHILLANCLKEIIINEDFKEKSYSNIDKIRKNYIRENVTENFVDKYF